MRIVATGPPGVQGQGVFYRIIIRPLLYLLPPEPAHNLTISLLSGLSRSPVGRWLLRSMRPQQDPRLCVRALGLEFPTPIGLAAGLDKNAEAYQGLAACGFGFVEVGTLTARAQPGNAQPRLFRLPADRALINRMGFNNGGADAAAIRIAAAARPDVPLGINIGKTKLVPTEQAEEDYAHSTRALAGLADYLVVNVSSPNTPGLRDLQAVATLRPLLERVRREADAACPERHVPLLVKIAPDLADADIDAVADLALELGLDGIIATNTTIARSGLSTAPSAVDACGAGGLSGAPLKARSLSVLKRLRRRVGDRLVLVSAGGVETVDDVWQRLLAGASLVQIYTALIYDGPGLPRRLARGLRRKLAEAGAGGVQEVIGRTAAGTAPAVS